MTDSQPVSVGNSPCYAGWVPTITGHLSFSMVGTAGNVSCIAANSISEASATTQVPLRYVIAAQRRRTKDVPLSWLMRFFLKWMVADYFLVAHTEKSVRWLVEGGFPKPLPDGQGQLSGQVVIVPRHRNPALRNRAKDAVGQIRRMIAEHNQSAIRDQPQSIDLLADSVSGIFGSTEAAGVHLLRANFTLCRTGECRITPIAIDARQRGATQLSSDRFLEVAAHQIFYFIKDISHRHYHHRTTSDNLLPVAATSAANDADWRRDTLWALVRAILEARRRDRLEGYKSALGILAYAEAFHSSLGRVRRRPGSDQVEIWEDRPFYDFTYTRASLEAKIGEREYIDSSRSTSKALLISTLLATIGLWIAAVQISEPLCRAQGLSPTCVKLNSWPASLL